MWRLILIIAVGFTGFWFGINLKASRNVPILTSEKEFPVTEHKSFVVLIYAHNQALWCEKALRSVFEQEYDHYRVVFIEDGSIDHTFEKANAFIRKNNQEEKVLLIRNEKRVGKPGSIYKGIDSCLEKEIVILLDGHDWLSSPDALEKLNRAYQNPDVWVAQTSAIHYPSYEIESAKHICFYSALFKQISLKEFFKEEQDCFIKPIQNLAKGRMKLVQDPIAFCNDAAQFSDDSSSIHK